MSKKITGVLLCMLMGVTLAACGNSSGTDNPKGQTTDQSEVSSSGERVIIGNTNRNNSRYRRKLQQKQNRLRRRIIPVSL